MNRLYLAWRYLRHQRAKTTILVASMTLILYLPLALQILVDRTARDLRRRADETPLVVGARGGALDLVLRALYFEGEVPAPTDMAQVDRIRRGGLADPVPLHLRFRVGAQPVVGTTLDYFEFRRLRVAEGQWFGILGECVLGDSAARELGVATGGSVVTSPENVFDLAGVYPLKLKVAGVLEPTHGPDDGAVFVDVRTAWVIAGIGHGHQDLATADEQALLRRENGSATANASLVHYNEITREQAHEFHFHGDPAKFPVTAILAVARDSKSRTILSGQYLKRDEPCQILRPSQVVEEVVAKVVRIRGYVVVAVGLVSLGTLMTSVLVFLLSIRLRRREIETMRKIGCSRGTVASLVVWEILIVLLTGALLAGVLAAITGSFATPLLRGLLV
ncbi:MAG: FtsX-like permease family protein [Planctomycetota bacterium]